MKKKVVIGLSGGVDSSVAAYLLKQQGYEVAGLFMRNWHDTEGTLSGDCPWHDDQMFAELVAKRLDIPFHYVDLSEQYRQRVVDYMFAEYERGRTPNPDVLCNREIKFDVFLKEALKLGADYVATGHYCRKTESHGVYSLLAGADANKDQSYFLCQLSQEQLKYALFPIGDMQKPDVRRIAEEQKLATAKRKDSQGICFVGKVDLPTFLQQKLTVRTGDIIEIPASWGGYRRGGATCGGTVSETAGGGETGEDAMCREPMNGGGTVSETAGGGETGEDATCRNSNCNATESNAASRGEMRCMSINNNETGGETNGEGTDGGTVIETAGGGETGGEGANGGNKTGSVADGDRVICRSDSDGGGCPSDSDGEVGRALSAGLPDVSDTSLLDTIAEPFGYTPDDGIKVGEHSGAHFYTIGQRKGLNVGGKPEPLFIIATDTERNIIYVGQGQSHPGLYRRGLRIRREEMHWIRHDLAPDEPVCRRYDVRIRYRQPLQRATLYVTSACGYIVFDEPQRGVTPGQFAAWYDGDELIGSGVIDE